jgi:outer membrane protein OmpA-like peptidoglycan-associated protein
MRKDKTIIIGLCASLLGTACAHGEPAHARNPSTRAENVRTVRDAKGPAHIQPVAARDALGRQDPEHSALTDCKGVGMYNPEQQVRSSEAHPAPAIASAPTGAGRCGDEVYFDSDSSRLPQTSQQSLDRLAECLKSRQADHATVVGQTDPTGTAQHNEQLGMARARAVADYLRTRGVPEDQIHVRSKGELASAPGRELWPSERKAGVSAAP